MDCKISKCSWGKSKGVILEIKKKNVAVILSGGIGSRFGLDIPKQFAKLAGKTIIEHTIEAFHNHYLIDEITIVIHKDWIWKIEEIVATNNYSKVEKILVGGEERKDSTLSAIAAYVEERDIVNFLFHDAVRPFVNNKIIDMCVDALQHHNAIDVAIGATDTIIEVENNIINNIPNRAKMMQGQTPQCFKYKTIEKAYKNAEKDPDFKPTDDCGIVRKYLPNENIYVVLGALENMKITHPQDIFLADKLIQLRTHNIMDRFSDAYYKDKLHSKVFVVFGGSKGIGHEIHKLATEYGAIVYSFSRGESNTDISVDSDVKKALEYVYNKENRIDYVINTASILVKKSLLNTQTSEILDIMNINYLGAINIIRHSISYLEKTHGQILNFTSSSYTRGRANYSLYSSTKVAIVNLTQALGEELLSKNIRINCINPERTLTPMRIASFGKEDPATLLNPIDVAYTSLNTLISQITGQIVDVKLQNVKANE